MQVDQTAEQAAISAAENWLALVDAGDYAQSWNQASSLSKSGIQTRWLFIPGCSGQQSQSILADVRTQFGRAVSRNLKSKQYAEELPYEPEGEYVVLKYETSFERYNGVETVTLMKEKDGAWRAFRSSSVDGHNGSVETGGRWNPDRISDRACHNPDVIGTALRRSARGPTCLRSCSIAAPARGARGGLSSCPARGQR